MDRGDRVDGHRLRCAFGRGAAHVHRTVHVTTLALHSDDPLLQGAHLVRLLLVLLFEHVHLPLELLVARFGHFLVLPQSVDLLRQLSVRLMELLLLLVPLGPLHVGLVLVVCSHRALLRHPANRDRAPVPLRFSRVAGHTCIAPAPAPKRAGAVAAYQNLMALEVSSKMSSGCRPRRLPLSSGSILKRAAVRPPCFARWWPHPGHVDCFTRSSFWCSRQKAWLQLVTRNGGLSSFQHRLQQSP